MSLLVFAGCGKDDEDGPGKSATSTTTTKTGTTATTGTTSTTKTTSTTSTTKTTKADDDEKGKTTTAKTTPAKPAPVAKTTNDCEQVRTPKPRNAGGFDRSKKRLDRSKTWIATVVTNCGTMQIELDVDNSPRTAASFAGLANEKFYDGLIFHRVVNATGPFVIQGGDPTGTGNGDAGYNVVEAPPQGTKYTRGVVAMAKTEIEDAGTSSSQFFIVLKKDAGLNPDYAVLGKVVGGIKIADRIGSVPTDPAADDRPTETMLIKSIRVRAKS